MSNNLKEVLSNFGGAKSEGYAEKAVGSGQVIGFSYSDAENHYKSCNGALIISWQDKEMTLKPATKETIAATCQEMGITETAWKP